MANKRMFTMKICDSDAFLDMPLSTQCLYFHLNMRADDDGFIGNSKRIVRLVGASEDDLKLLIAKRFVLAFEDGVIVIKHWRMHNTLSQNRYHETQYLEEKEMLRLKENGSYSLDGGTPLDDTKLIESSTRQSRRTKDGHETDSDIDLDIDIDKDLDLDIGLDKGKGKRKKPAVYYPTDEALNQAFLDYIDARKKMKKPMTEKAIELAMRELDKLAGTDNDLAIKILNQSVFRGWMGLFPLKEDKQTNNTASDYVDMWRNA
jgi:hypothetical protein